MDIIHQSKVTFLSNFLSPCHYFLQFSLRKKKERKEIKRKYIYDKTINKVKVQISYLEEEHCLCISFSLSKQVTNYFFFTKPIFQWRNLEKIRDAKLNLFLYQTKTYLNVQKNTKSRNEKRSKTSNDKTNGQYIMQTKLQRNPTLNLCSNSCLPYI